MQNFLSLLVVDENGVVTLEAPAGAGTIGAIDAYDIGECGAKLLATGEPLNAHAVLTGPENIPMRRVAKAFGGAVGADFSYVDLDPLEYRVLHEAEDPGSTDDIVGVYAEVREGTMAVHSGDVECITGSSPRSIEQFAAANVDAINAAIASASSKPGHP
jgi:hypothetical protein